MKTASTSPCRSASLAAFAAALLIPAGVIPTVSIAVNPPAETPTAAAPANLTADPYIAYLEELETRNTVCLEHSRTLQGLLAGRDQLLRAFLRSSAETRAALLPDIAALERQIDDTEAMLETAVAATQPGDAPGLEAPPVIDIEAIREQAKRWRRPIFLPAPPPLVVPELPAPARESLYLEYLRARAGNAKFAQDLVTNVAQLLHERRELAYRHAHLRAHERARLEDTMRAVSLHIRISSRAVAEGVAVTGW